MKILFIGAVKFSKKALLQTTNSSADVVGVCTLSKSSFNSDHCDLTDVAESYDIPVLDVNDINSSETCSWIRDKKPDVIFCFGWSRLLKKEILKIAPLGVIGFHPALLPQNRGRHPLIWALALGLEETGSTFFFMDEGADSGDILSQMKVRILKSDNAYSMYEKISNVALGQIKEFIPNLQNNNFKRIIQNHTNANYWRKRNINDGQIDWRMDASNIYNLVRALSYPYVGAHFSVNDKYYKVWKSKVVHNDNKINCEPGKIVKKGKSDFTISCGSGLITILKTEPIFNYEKYTYL